MKKKIKLKKKHPYTWRVMEREIKPNGKIVYETGYKLKKISIFNPDYFN